MSEVVSYQCNACKALNDTNTKAIDFAPTYSWNRPRPDGASSGEISIQVYLGVSDHVQSGRAHLCKKHWDDALRGLLLKVRTND